MKKIKENISEIESCLAKTKDINNLIDLLINDYFGMGKIGEKERLTLEIDYKFYQSLVFVISDVLKNIEKDLDENITKIYEEFRNLK